MCLRTLRGRRVLAHGSLASVGHRSAAWLNVPTVWDHAF